MIRRHALLPVASLVVELAGGLHLSAQAQAPVPAGHVDLDALTRLDRLSMQSPPVGGRPSFDFAALRAFQARRNAFLLAEGVAAVLEPGPRVGDSGSVLVSSGGSRSVRTRSSTGAGRTTRTLTCTISSCPRI